MHAFIKNKNKSEKEENKYQNNDGISNKLILLNDTENTFSLIVISAFNMFCFCFNKSLSSSVTSIDFRSTAHRCGFYTTGPRCALILGVREIRAYPARLMSFSLIMLAKRPMVSTKLRNCCARSNQYIAVGTDSVVVLVCDALYRQKRKSLSN